MPAYTQLRTLIAALQTGETHITQCLESFFADPNDVTRDPNYSNFVGGNWSGGPPAWLGTFLDSIGLRPEERDHVLRWPPSELEKARAAAAAAVQAGQSVKFRWELYHGNDPVTEPSTTAALVLFRSPGSKLRLTKVNYGEVYVEDV